MDRFGKFTEQERDLLLKAITIEFRRKQQVLEEFKPDYPRLTARDLGLDVIENLWKEIQGEL